MADQKVKANPDYSQSALAGINNPPEVKSILDVYHEQQAVVSSMRKELEALPQHQKYCEAVKYQDELRQLIEQAIDAHGNYQDVDAGVYGLRQVRRTAVYNAMKFADNFPREAAIVIEQVVNVKALEGLFKGGILEPQELERAGVTSHKETFAYIIK